MMSLPSNPLVSVVIATYNNRNLLDRTVQNILQQTYSNMELIVVDDGSTDGTRDLMVEMATRDSRLRYVYQMNQERGAARNRGIREARGEYVAFIDQDDLWHPTKLERQILALLEEPSVDCCYCLRGVLHHDGRETYDQEPLPPDGDIFEPLLYRCFVGSMTPIIRRSCFDRVGGFCEDRRLACFCDWELWTRLASMSRWRLLPEFLGLHCLHAGNTQRAPEWYEDELRIQLMGHYELSQEQRRTLHSYGIARRWHWATKLYKEAPLTALHVLTRIALHAPERLIHRNFWGLVFRSGVFAVRKQFS